MRALDALFDELFDALGEAPCVVCGGPRAGPPSALRRDGPAPGAGLGPGEGPPPGAGAPGGRPPPGAGPAPGDWHRWLCPACADEVPLHLARVGHPPGAVTSAWALGPYAGPVGAMVRHGKYHQSPEVLDALGAALAEDLAAFPEVDLLVGVPASLWRLLGRGFDPVSRLARPLAARLGRPLVPALERRHRAPQARLGHAARAAHSRGVFRANRVLEGTVLLVDDVCTTGATAAACADELLGAGARRVHLVTLAAVRFS